jgi:transglutaminase-like putative cysteine protease
MRLIRLIWAIFTVLTPFTGVWLAGALALYTGGPLWAAILSAALVFPVIPLWWEYSANKRYARRVEASAAKKKDPPRRFLTVWDRIILRTLFVSLTFIGAMLAALPTQSFAALATRGDWMLTGRTGPAADSARRIFFLAAEGAEGLYTLARTDNPYAQYASSTLPTPTPTPPPSPIAPKPQPDTTPDPAAPIAQVEPPPTPNPDSTPPTDPTPDPTVKVEQPLPVAQPVMRSGQIEWPMQATLHPLVTSMPPEAEQSIASVARYIKEREPDPVQRVKALHDYVADRIAYDAVALAENNFPSQEAEDVFRAKMAVCAGYATLLEALGEQTGDEIVVVTGVARDMGGRVDGVGHAWNAVKIGELWYLMDATWNAGTVEGRTFTKHYTTDYLFTPPHIFAHDHLPEQEDWQLLAKPITRAEFMRQPVLRPEFFAAGLELVSPTRSQVDAQGQIEVKLRNPNRQRILANLVPVGGDSDSSPRCTVKGVTDVTITCPIKQAGAQQVWIFSTKRGNSYPFVGQIEVQGKP